MKNEEFRKLTVTVEMGETYIGGDNRNRYRNKRLRGRGVVGKIAIIGAIARRGNVVAKNDSIHNQRHGG